MRTLHFYCSTENVGPYETELSHEDMEKRTDCMLTERMVDYVVRACGEGKPPFRLNIPRFIAYDAAIWAMRNPLFDVHIVGGRPLGDAYPFDEASITFDGCIAFIHARRCVPVES